MSSFLLENTASVFAAEKTRLLRWYEKHPGVGNCRYLLYIVLLLPVFFFRDFTPANELKYLSIVDEALANGTWFTFYNHGEIYADKPPLFFWLIMLSKVLTKDYYMAIISLFTLMPAIGVLIIMNKWLKAERIAYNPIVSELLLLTTLMFIGASLIVRMDMLMTFFIVLSLYTFFRIYKNKHTRSERFLLPVYIFLGVFSKGAMGFLIPLISIFSFLLIKKKLKTFGHYLGWRQWGILLGLFALWFILVFVEGGAIYLHNLLFKQTVGRGINSFHHKEPFWFYFPRMLVTFAPWSLLYVALIWQGIKKRVIKGDVRLFFAVIVVVNIVVLSAVSSKIDIYMLPLYPFIVYLCASLLPHFDQTMFTRVTATIPACLAILAFPFSFLILDKIPYTYHDLSMVHLGLFLFLIAGGIAFRQKRIQDAIIAFSFGMLSLIFSASFALPQFNKYLGFEEMATEAYRVAQLEGISEYAYYKFPTAQNMNVYLGEDVKGVTSVGELEYLVNTTGKSILFVRETEMIRDQELSQWLEKHRLVWNTGRYRWYILNSVSLFSDGEHYASSDIVK